MNAYYVKLIFYKKKKKDFIKKKTYISPKLIEWNMVDNYATDIKGDA